MIHACVVLCKYLHPKLQLVFYVWRLNQDAFIFPDFPGSGWNSAWYRGGGQIAGRRTGGVGEELIIVTHLGSTETPFTHVKIPAPFPGKVGFVSNQFTSRL